MYAPLRAEGAPPTGLRELAQLPVSGVVEHILARYHAVHRAQFRQLVRLARRVEQVHGPLPECPEGLADHVAAMAQEIDSHMRKEERVLFPLLLRGEAELARAPIAVMLLEHEDHAAALRSLSRMTGDLVAPACACATWRALYAGLRVFRDDLADHIRIENDILFARFARAAVH